MEDVVNLTLKVKDILRVSDSSKIDFLKQVQQEKVGRVIDTDYDTVWSTTFTMDSVVREAEEVWMV